MTVSVNTIIAEDLCDLFKNLSQKDLLYQKNVKNGFKNPVKNLEIAANVGNAAASRNPEAALSTLPDVISFYHTGNDLYHGNFL